jgi:hypothetical protein
VLGLGEIGCTPDATPSSIGTTGTAFTVNFARAFAFAGAFRAFSTIGVAFFALGATNFCYSLSNFLIASANFFAAAFASLSTFLFAFSFASSTFLIAFAAR